MKDRIEAYRKELADLKDLSNEFSALSRKRGREEVIKAPDTQDENGVWHIGQLRRTYPDSNVVLDRAVTMSQSKISKIADDILERVMDEFPNNPSKEKTKILMETRNYPDELLIETPELIPIAMVKDMIQVYRIPLNSAMMVNFDRFAERYRPSLGLDE